MALAAAACGWLVASADERPLSASADERPLSASADQSPRWYLQIDNDVVFGTDRWYTSGVRIARLASSGGAASEWGILQEAYTPEAKRWRRGLDDRAPSARLLAYHARHAIGDRSLGTLELALGVRGPSALGRESTEAVHELVPAPEVDWSREERDRVDVQLAAVRSRGAGDLVFHYGAVAGNQQAFAHGGVEWRMGAGGARAAFSPAMRFAATPPPAAGEPGWGAFVGASARAVARNAMIRRNYDVFGAEIEPRRGVARLAAGIACVQPWGAATLAIVRDTREFEAQRTPHGFGALTLHVEF